MYIFCFGDTNESEYFSYTITQKIMPFSVAAMFSDAVPDNTLSNLGCAWKTLDRQDYLTFSHICILYSFLL